MHTTDFITAVRILKKVTKATTAQVLLLTEEAHTARHSVHPNQALRRILSHLYSVYLQLQLRRQAHRLLRDSAEVFTQIIMIMLLHSPASMYHLLPRTAAILSETADFIFPLLPRMVLPLLIPIQLKKAVRPLTDILMMTLRHGKEKTMPKILNPEVALATIYSRTDKHVFNR